jgi:hypothetical protein
MKNPGAKMWLDGVAISVLIALALFFSAGTIDYWQAWSYLGVSAVPSVLLILFMSKDPILVENRTKAGPTAEKRTIQKIIVLCTDSRPSQRSWSPALTAVSAGPMFHRGFR